MFTKSRVGHTRLKSACWRFNGGRRLATRAPTRHSRKVRRSLLVSVCPTRNVDWVWHDTALWHPPNRSMISYRRAHNLHRVELVLRRTLVRWRHESTPSHTDRAKPRSKMVIRALVYSDTLLTNGHARVAQSATHHALGRALYTALV